MRNALEELPDEGDTVTFRAHILEDGRNVGMLLWLVLHMVFDAVAQRTLAAHELDPEHRWLTALVPADWTVAPLRMRSHYCDAVGIVLAHLYSEAREGWEWPSEPAPDRPDLTERFLIPPLPRPVLDED